MSQAFGADTFATGLFSGGQPGWVYRPQVTAATARTPSSTVGPGGVPRPDNVQAASRPGA